MNDGKCRVLLIEDDHDDADMIIYTLRKLSFVEVLHIDEGERGLRYLFEEAVTFPDIILLDLRMPRVDGVEVLRQLKADTVKRSIPVAAMVSSPEGKRYVESFGLKADGYIMKPVFPEKFLFLLSEIGLSQFQMMSSHQTKGV